MIIKAHNSVCLCLHIKSIYPGYIYSTIAQHSDLCHLSTSVLSLLQLIISETLDIDVSRKLAREP